MICCAIIGDCLNLGTHLPNGALVHRFSGVIHGHPKNHRCFQHAGRGRQSHGMSVSLSWLICLSKRPMIGYLSITSLCWWFNPHVSWLNFVKRQFWPHQLAISCANHPITLMIIIVRLERSRRIDLWHRKNGNSNVMWNWNTHTYIYLYIYIKFLLVFHM